MIKLIIWMLNNYHKIQLIKINNKYKIIQIILKKEMVPK